MHSLASPRHPYVASLLREIIKAHNQLDPTTAQDFFDKGEPEMRGLGLDELTIVGPDIPPNPNAVLVGHSRGKPKPAIRELANRTKGNWAYFAIRKLWNDKGALEPALVVEGAALSEDHDSPSYSLALTMDRRVADDLLAIDSTLEGKILKRIVSPTGEVLLPSPPPAAAAWSAFASEAPVRLPLTDIDDKPIAFIEVAVGDNDLERVQRDVTLASAGLALVALALVVLVGLAVARRTARDLDRLVEGSLAAARGDLDHRVPIGGRDEVGAVANAFNFMMEDLKTSKERLVIAERIAAWQEIARRLAHEIKNPLTPIQMAMDTLRKSWKKQHPSFDEILDESTTTVLQEADRLKHIVTEFSDFARMPKPEFGRVDLNELIRSSLALYQGAVPIDIQLGPMPELDADKNQLSQVLLNLIENARDAISQRIDPAKGHISVSTKLGEAADRVMLVVEDNGPGVPTDLKDKVFAPYFTTKHAKGGTGLGLAIVHRIVSDHGGRIMITDARGGGARFSIELPLRNGTALLASRI